MIYLWILVAASTVAIYDAMATGGIRVSARTYFRPWGFSINEGRIPTVAVIWEPKWFVYLKFSQQGRAIVLSRWGHNA